MSGRCGSGHGRVPTHVPLGSVQTTYLLVLSSSSANNRISDNDSVDWRLYVIPDYLRSTVVGGGGVIVVVVEVVAVVVVE